MFISSKVKTSLNFGILFSMILLIIFLVIFPTVGKIEEIGRETEQLKTLLAAKHERALSARLTKKRIEEIKLDCCSFQEYVFKSSDALKLIQLLENLAAKNNVQQKILNSNLDRISTASKISIALGLGGDYDDLLNHLSDLERSQYFFNIEELRFRTSGLDKEGNQKASLVITVGLHVNK